MVSISPIYMVANWRKRVGVEPTILAAKDRINGFEGHEGHRTPFASELCAGLDCCPAADYSRMLQAITGAPQRAEHQNRRQRARDCHPERSEGSLFCGFEATAKQREILRRSLPDRLRMTSFCCGDKEAAGHDRQQRRRYTETHQKAEPFPVQTPGAKRAHQRSPQPGDRVRDDIGYELGGRRETLRRARSRSFESVQTS
jgi:hypothetical protein